MTPWINLIQFGQFGDLPETSTVPGKFMAAFVLKIAV